MVLRLKTRESRSLPGLQNACVNDDLLFAERPSWLIEGPRKRLFLLVLPHQRTRWNRRMVTRGGAAR